MLHIDLIISKSKKTSCPQIQKLKSTVADTELKCQNKVSDMVTLMEKHKVGSSKHDFIWTGHTALDLCILWLFNWAFLNLPKFPHCGTYKTKVITITIMIYVYFL